MKKMFFLAATAALALSSCSSEDVIEQSQAIVEDGAVTFSAYTARNTRAAVTDLPAVKALGFGVYAYEQNTTPWSTYRASNTVPNFFYNQKVDFGGVTAWAVTTPITRAQYAELVDTDIKALYNGTSGQFTSTKTADAAAIAALTAASLTESDFLDATVTVTYKQEITDAEKTAASTIGSTVFTGGSSDHNTPATATGTPTLTAYLAYTAGDLAVITNVSVAYKSPLSHAKYNELAASTASALKANYRADVDANEPKYTASAPTVTPSKYDALTDVAAKALCTASAFAGSKFDYTPHKYFSNNDGALHSFFAYAPYQKNVTAVFSKGLTGPAIRYNAADDYDLLWGEEGSSTHANVDKPKQAATGSAKIEFNFKHALAKVSFDVSYFNDQVHSDHTEGKDFLDENTTITVRSVKFVGNVPSQGLLNLYDGSWTYETTEESAYEVVPATPFTFTWDGVNDAANTPKPLKSNMMVIPTMSTDNVKIQVVYDVTTVDPTDPKNNSTVTNTITSDTAYPLAKGTAYLFHLHLGITSVKFDATVAAWGGETEQNVDLPNNE